MWYAKCMMKTRPYDICNKIIIAVNILVFLVLEMLGDTESGSFMYAHGALYPDVVLVDGEWYRLFTCMFIHFGIRHIGNNMLILFFLGDNLERALGHVKYVVLYLISGLCGSTVSLAYMVKSGDYAVAGGASGAIFGVIGALIYVVIRNKGRLEDLTAGRLIFMAALSLYYGFTAEGVDNLAHLGGLVSGILLAVVLYRKKSSPRNRAWDVY